MSKDCTIQDVFHRFYPSFESTHDISPCSEKSRLPHHELQNRRLWCECKRMRGLRLHISPL